MRLEKLKQYLDERKQEYIYHEVDGCGSLDFNYRGVPYQVWEFEDNGIWGVETNVRNGGSREDITGEYEDEVIEVIRNWQ